MIPEAQRIAVAEACGWTYGKHKEPSFVNPSQDIEVFGWNDSRGVWFRRLPDYLSDLNAVHEAEKVLTEQQQATYALFMHPISGRSRDDHLGKDFDAIHATAAQRVEAFLKTVGKWDNSK